MNGVAFTKFELLTSPSFEKIRILGILFLTTQRDPRKFPASTAVPVLAFPSSYLKVPIKFTGTHLYTWVERGFVKVKCLAWEHNNLVTWCAHLCQILLSYYCFFNSNKINDRLLKNFMSKFLLSLEYRCLPIRSQHLPFRSATKKTVPRLWLLRNQLRCDSEWTGGCSKYTGTLIYRNPMRQLNTHL